MKNLNVRSFKQKIRLSNKLNFTSLQRSFGGKLNGFVNNDESHFERNHLKAYLQGKKSFHFGFETKKLPITDEAGIQTLMEIRVPKMFKVLENWA